MTESKIVMNTLMEIFEESPERTFTRKELLPMLEERISKNENMTYSINPNVLCGVLNQLKAKHIVESPSRGVYSFVQQYKCDFYTETLQSIINILDDSIKAVDVRSIIGNPSNLKKVEELTELMKQLQTRLDNTKDEK